MIEENSDDPIRTAKAEVSKIAAEEKAVAADPKTTEKNKSGYGFGAVAVVGLLIGVVLAIFTGVHISDLAIVFIVCLLLMAPITFFWPKIKPWLVKNDLWKEEGK